MWLLARRLSRQGSARPEGAEMLAVRRLRSVSVMSREKSAAEPSFTWDRLFWSSIDTDTDTDTDTRYILLCYRFPRYVLSTVVKNIVSCDACLGSSHPQAPGPAHL